jgi:hypothetical protein
MARGGHRLPKVSLAYAMNYPSMPGRQATPETALWPAGWASAAILYPFGHLTPNASGRIQIVKGLTALDRNFPSQTLKIRNVSLVVMGS